MHGYPWFDWETGRVDRCQLLAHLSGEPCEEAPPWLLALEIPEVVENARPTDLAKIDAIAHRAWQSNG